jgi:hypothetical protein
MNDPAMAMTLRENSPRQVDNLKVAKREKMALNIGVDLSCSQTSYQKRLVPAGGIAP